MVFGQVMMSDNHALTAKSQGVHSKPHEMRMTRRIRPIKARNDPMMAHTPTAVYKHFGLFMRHLRKMAIYMYALVSGKLRHHAYVHTHIRMQ